MKKTLKKWTLRLMIVTLLLFGFLLVIILYPNLTYANKTVHHSFTIYHHNALDPQFPLLLDQVSSQLSNSELYHPDFSIDICLNDGAAYPTLIKTLRGQAFAWGFYNKVVLQGTMNAKDNTLSLNGYKWNLKQLLIHEVIHCLQFHKWGFFKANPIANIPNWKWEGYAEYIARQNTNTQSLIKNLDRIALADKDSWAITLEDSTITPREYYHYWNYVQYCIDIQHQSYAELLKSSVTENQIKVEMEKWYKEQNKNHAGCFFPADLRKNL